MYGKAWKRLGSGWLMDCWETLLMLKLTQE